MSWLQHFQVSWRTCVVLFVPVLASPILAIDGSKEMACLYGVVLMACYWITEALPLAVTAVSSVFIFPMLGVIPAKTVASSFVKDASIFSFTCLTFAVCLEKWKLHKRIALSTLLLMGTTPKWLVMGFMLPTWFLSMWVNNTSATAMMIPIVMAVLSQLQDLENAKAPGSSKLLKESHGENGDAELKVKHDVVNMEQDKNAGKLRSQDSFQTYTSKEQKQMCKALCLCVCYSATLGGVASLTGTSTNLIAQGQAEELFNAYGLESGLNFLTWIMCCFPVSFLCILLAWIWLVCYMFGIRELFKCDYGTEDERQAVKNVIRSQLKELGPLSFAEKAIVAHFIVLLASWLSLKFPGGVGWSYYFKNGYVNNSTPGILVVMSLFAFPSERPRVFCFKKPSDSSDASPRSVPALMDWTTLHEKFPWGTWCLINGGYALAVVCQKSGLSLWVGLKLSVFSDIEPWMMLLVLSVSVSFLTEVTSNAATASIICPIMAELAITLQLNPLYLILPVALSCSMAFMLPVATAPNTLVFAAGHIRIKDMAKAGFMLNLLCILIINLATNTWINTFLDLATLPPEMRRLAPDSNVSVDLSCGTNFTTPLPLNFSCES